MALVLAYLHRLAWFGIAGAVGFGWVYGELVTGRSLPPHGHAIYGAMFAAALTTAGFDLRQLLAWRRLVSQINEATGQPPKQQLDAQRLAAILHEQDPSKLEPLRRALQREEPGR